MGATAGLEFAIRHPGKATALVIAAGGPADLVLTRARTIQELISRPQTDRVVVVDGRAIDSTPPDYRELDRLIAR